MKPPPFEYLRPASVDETLAALATHGGEAKLLAGGQSLVPLLNFRMLRPALLVDINRVQDLAYIEEQPKGLRIGALTRHHAVETSPLVAHRFPVLTAAMAYVAHLAIRNRGTIGGSLAHADPAAELPMLMLLLDAEIGIRSAGGSRREPAGEFFVGPLTTTLADDEMVTDITLPALPPGSGWGFEEVALRSGDFAIAAVAATLAGSGEAIEEARLAVMGVDETPLRLSGVEAHLAGERFTPDLVRDVAQQARAAVQPNGDLRGSADYRRHLVGVLTERALRAAWHRAAREAA